MMKMTKNEQRDNLLQELKIIWWSDLLKKVEEDPLYSLPRYPKNTKGMTIIGIVSKFPIEEDYLLDYENPARLKTIQKSTPIIKQISELMLSGEWEPKHYIPPTIEWWGESKFKHHTGHLTKTGAETASKETLYMMVVEFHDEDGKTADYWREIWTSNENDVDGSYIKLLRSDEDIIEQVCNMLAKGKIKVDKAIPDDVPTVDETLKDMNITPDPAAVLKNAILLKGGYNDIAIQPFTSTMVAKEIPKYEKKYPDYFFTSTSYSNTSQTKRDYERVLVCCVKFLEDPEKYNEKTMKVLYGAAGAAVNKIDTLRKEKKNLTAEEAVRNLWNNITAKEKESGYKFGMSYVPVKQKKDDPKMTIIK
jgi:hypothetical protein